ncbi:MAG: hypothetical protein ACPGMR_10030 [Pontibacterium sp.]
MLTYQECLDMCDLDPAEVDAIAEHEHLDPMLALALGQYLITHQGEQKIKKIILDDIEKAHRCGNHTREQLLQSALEHFVANHPDSKVLQAIAA